MIKVSLIVQVSNGNSNLFMVKLLFLYSFKPGLLKLAGLRKDLGMCFIAGVVVDCKFAVVLSWVDSGLVNVFVNEVVGILLSWGIIVFPVRWSSVVSPVGLADVSGFRGNGAMADGVGFLISK